MRHSVGTEVRGNLGRLGLRVGLIGALLALAGCATVVRGTHQTLRIVSTPDGALAQISSGESCVTPCAVELSRADAIEVRVSKARYVTQLVKVRSVGTGSGAIGLVSNAVFGGIVGVSVDSSSGALHSLTPNPVNVHLVEAIRDDAPVPESVRPADLKELH